MNIYTRIQEAKDRGALEAHFLGMRWDLTPLIYAVYILLWILVIIINILVLSTNHLGWILTIIGLDLVSWYVYYNLERNSGV